MTPDSQSPDQIRLALIAKILDRTDVPDRDWLQDFWLSLQGSALYVKAEQVVFDPAQRPYFAVHLTEDGEQVQPARLGDIFDYLREFRLGLVVFVEGRGRLSLSHGHILSWQLYGTPYPPRFWGEPEDSDQVHVLAQDTEMLVGPPNDEMLPPVVRNVLRHVMANQLGIENPRVGLIREKGTDKASRIIFDIDPEKFGGIDQGAEVYGVPVWYMPYCIPSYYMPSSAGDAWMVPL